MKDLSFIGVSGFFSSGSSAVIDFLKEFQNTYECKAEIRIIKDPYGISQLEQALVHHWELLNSSAAVQDFLCLCNIYNRTGGHVFSPAGLSYGKNISPDFMKITQEYVDELTDFTYESDFYYQKIKKPYLKFVIDRIRYGIEFYTKGKIRSANRKNKPSYFAHPTEEQFLAATRKYLVRLFEKCLPEEVEKGYILLDQAISTNDTDALNRYFTNGKLIIVDRDPRDMYVEDLERWRENLDFDTASADAGRRYVLRHKALRQGIPTADNMMVVRFEELILNYERESRRIREFVGFPEEAHINPHAYLKPEVSAKNIGVWKQYYEKYRDAIDTIAKMLPEYCVV